MLPLASATKNSLVGVHIDKIEGHKSKLLNIYKHPHPSPHTELTSNISHFTQGTNPTSCPNMAIVPVYFACLQT